MITYLLTSDEAQANITQKRFDTKGFNRIEVLKNVSHRDPGWREIVPVGEPKRIESHGWEGTLCCTFGHAIILGKFLAGSDEAAIIIEDDAIPECTYMHLGWKLKKTEFPWDFVHLGSPYLVGERPAEGATGMDENFLRVKKSSSGTFGYVINRRFAEHMLPLLLPATDHIDCLYQANSNGFTVLQSRETMVSHDRSVPSRRF